MESLPLKSNQQPLFPKRCIHFIFTDTSVDHAILAVVGGRIYLGSSANQNARFIGLMRFFDEFGCSMNSVV